jgi:arylsulfatase A-like enzyme
MTGSLNRRDFLKLLALLPPSAFFSRFVEAPEHPLQDSSAQNVLVVVFDTFSAQHISFYGYPRDTMPNLARIAQKATVYHNHHAGGNWTTPGTATLLTGTYPWTHRAFSERDHIASDGVKRNIFTLFDRYYRIGYSHNSIVNGFLYQFYNELDFLKPQKDLFAANNLSFDRLFPWDGDIAPITWDRIMTEGEKGYTYSLFFAELYEKYHQHAVAGLVKDFPRGLPHTGEDSYFRLEDAVDWLSSQLNTIRQPFLGYFHYLPPHRPYNTRRDFVNVFADDKVGYYLDKPRHPIFDRANFDKPVNLNYQTTQRQLYDEFILYVDAEFGRLHDFMQKRGLLENTWIIFTSDHGEMFERGIYGHKTPLLYEPVIKIPLLILEPGQQTRRDVFAPTSAVDLLPTLAHISGQQVPGWTEGQVLPPFAEAPAATEHRIFALEATHSRANGPLNPASLMMIKGNYKLTYYFGYDQLDESRQWFELYDLRNDPEELNNIYDSQPGISRELRDELLAKLKEVDRPYQKS